MRSGIEVNRTPPHRVPKTMGFGGMLVVASVGFGQLAQAPLPRLEAPIGVDVNVQSVSWSPTGNALLYTKKEAAGTAIGIYGTGLPEGRVLFHIGPDDRMESQWFDGAPFVAVIVYRQVPGAEGPRHQADVHLLDAKTLKDRLVFSRTFESKSGIEIDVDPSPGLVHAIFRVKDGETKRHMVLATSLGPLIASPDLDAAVKEGFQGPSWSIDGTAVYGKGGQSETNAQFDSSTGTVRVQFVLERDLRAKILGDLPLLGKLFLAKKPAPPIGTPVLEVMPGNGALRQVRFRGEWVSEEPELPPIGSSSKVHSLPFGVSRGQAHGLWLTRGEENPEEGVLIAPHAGEAWLAPRNRAVAYLVDGALFVRTFGK